MADVFTKEKRSEIMSRIRSRHTSPELLVYRYLRREKVYFRKHYKNAPGNPDIALPMKKRAVFIDGDFWHGWKFASRKDKLPKVYWQEKIAANMRRDRLQRARLKRTGWKVLRVWEHELKKNPEPALSKIKAFLLEFPSEGRNIDNRSVGSILCKYE